MAVRKIYFLWLAGLLLSSGAPVVKEPGMINLSNTKLESIPLIFHTQNITKLLLSNNFINMSAVDEAVLKTFSNLTELHLDGNLLTDVPEKLFETMSKLKVLNLSNNSITTVKPKAFSGLANLSELDLSQNLLKSLPVDLLAGLQKLTILRVQKNKLQMLNISVDRNHLQNVDLEDNLWNCTCLFLNMIKLMTDSGVNISSQATCASPNNQSRILDSATYCLSESKTTATSISTTEVPQPATQPSSALPTRNTLAVKNNSKVSDKDVDPGSSRPALGNTWKFLLGVGAIVLSTATVLVCAVKSPSWYKLLFNYRHQRLREEEDVNGFSTSRYSNFSLDTEHTETTANDLDQRLDDEEDDDGYIEDRYIETGDYEENTET
ncbi:hypothetical protein UPYG_G00351250 [Umbra pygmaea]|uniref:Leucine-rich repeat-containing protein 19 n=1 Tax=Umbra pygmaea TaxID=75934 RepID=A0ABD0W2K1_UMBPY